MPIPPEPKSMVNDLVVNLHAVVYAGLYNEYCLGDKILEVGCGKNPIKGVTLKTDFDDRIVGKNGVIKVNVLSMPFKDKEFDLVVARNFIGCFECIGRPDLKATALNEMKRVARAVYVRETRRRWCLINQKRHVHDFLARHPTALKIAIIVTAAWFGLFEARYHFWMYPDS